MLTLKRVLEKQKQRCIQKSVLEDWFVGLWPIRILQAYGPKFRQLKKSITIYILLMITRRAMKTNCGAGRATS